MKFLKGKNLSFIFSKSNVYNGLIQLFTIGVNLLLMPILLDVLGKERFGVWQTILSLIGYVALLNFGMGNGLRNTISKYYVDHNFEAIGNLTGQTIVKLLKIILCFAVVVFPLYFYFFEPNFLFKDTKALSLEIKYSIAIFLVFFLVNIISSLASSVSFGLNKSYLPGLFNLIYLSVVCVILSILKYGDLKKIAIVFGLIQLFVNSLFFVLLLNRNNIKLSFKNKYPLKETSSLSGQFFIVQLLSIVFLTADNFIISNKLGPIHTSEYAIVSKMYFTLISIFSILLISFWNGVTIAFAKNNLQWIRNGIKQLLLLSFFVLLIGLLFSFTSEYILKIWFGEKSNLVIAPITFVLFSVFAFLHCINAVFINFQNGMGDMKRQRLSTFLMVIVLLLFSFFLHIEKVGYNLVIIIKIVALLLGIIINVKSIKLIK